MWEVSSNPFRLFLLYPCRISSHTWADLYSAEYWRGNLCWSTRLSLCAAISSPVCSFINSSPLFLPRFLALSRHFSELSGSAWVSPSCSLALKHCFQCLWDYCHLLPNVQCLEKSFFIGFIQFFKNFRQEVKSGIYYYILVGNRIYPYPFFIWLSKTHAFAIVNHIALAIDIILLETEEVWTTLKQDKIENFLCRYKK